MASFEQQALFAYVAVLRDAAVLSRIDALERELTELRAKCEEVTQRRGPGRPRKQANG